MFGHFNFLAFTAAMVLAQTTAQHSTPHCEGGDRKYKCQGQQFHLQKENDDDLMRVNWENGTVHHTNDEVVDAPDEEHMKNIIFFSPCSHTTIQEDRVFEFCVCRQEGVHNAYTKNKLMHHEKTGKYVS